MKILMIHPHDIYSTTEPWTVRIREIAKELVHLGHKVKLVYFPLPLHQRGSIEPRISTLQTIPFSRRKYALPMVMLKVLQLAKWADVIHFQKCFSHASLPALFAGAVLHKPVHYDWDDDECAIYNFEPPSKLYGIYLKYLEESIPYLADTLSYSSDQLKIKAKKLGMHHSRLFEAHVGADLKHFYPSIDGSNIKKIYAGHKKLVLYMGQLHGGQYAELFLHAIPFVKIRRKDVQFMVLGGGYKLQELRQKARQLHISGDVIFTGFIQHKEIPKYISAADVCVASFEDNSLTRAKSPLKIVEYMAMGKAIVASDVGEVPKMLGESGYKAIPGDAKDLATGILHFLDNPSERLLSQKLARLQVLEKYNWRVTAKNLLAAYQLAYSTKYINNR